MKTIYFKFFAAIILVWICGCNYSQVFDPEFSTEQSPKLDSIRSKYDFKDLQVQGKKMSGTGGNHTNLTISFINGKNVPTKIDEITVLAKQLDIIMKGLLKNPNQFESYTILFTTKTVDGSVTTNKNVGHEFKLGEI